MLISENSHYRSFALYTFQHPTTKGNELVELENTPEMGTYYCSLEQEALTSFHKMTIVCEWNRP